MKNMHKKMVQSYSMDFPIKICWMFAGLSRWFPSSILGLGLNFLFNMNISVINMIKNTQLRW